MDEFKTIIFIFGDKKGKLILVRTCNGKYDGAFVDGLHTGTITTIKVNEGKLPIEKKGIAVPQKTDIEASPEKHLIFNDEEQKHLDNTAKEELLKQEKENRSLLEPNKVPIKIGDGDIMVATGSLDRQIKILVLKGILKPEKFNFKNVSTLMTVRHRYRIADIDWDPFDSDRFLNVAQKHVTVQIWTINPSSSKPRKNTDDKNPRDDTDIDKYYVANIRGHKGFITTACWSRQERNCVLTCSDDQSIKVWNLINIRSRQPPIQNKKEVGDDEPHADDDDRRDDDRYGDRDDFGQRNGRSKLESYKQSGEERRPIRYRIQSDDEDDQEHAFEYQAVERN